MKRIWVCGLLVLTLAPASMAERVSRDTGSILLLMASVDRNLNPSDEVSEASLLLIHPNGQQKRWRVKQFYQRAPENQMGAILVRFLDPAEVRGTTLVSVNQPGGENYQWLNLPAFRTPQLLDDAKKSDYVFGSDLTFEDYVPYVLQDYAYEWMSEEDLEGRPAVVIRVTPTTPKLKERVVYTHQMVWIDVERLVILRADAFDAQNRLFKTSTWTDFYRPDRVHWRARRRTVFSPLRPHWTEMNMENIKINQGLSIDFFSEQSVTSVR